MLKNQYANVFAGTPTNQNINPATSVTLVPVVSGEWNQNLFNQPFATVAGLGVAETIGSPTVTVPSGTTPLIVDATSTANGYDNGFSTSALQVSHSGTSISYIFNTASPHAPAYKIVTYVQTDSDLPIQLSAYASGSSSQFGSKTVDINAFGFVKVITYVGSSGVSDLINSLTYNLVFNTYNSSDLPTPINVYYTQPQVYPTTYSDYQNGSLWPTDSPFSYFRPGESYVPTGNVYAWHSSTSPFGDGYREIMTPIINGQGGMYSPITPITQNYKFALATAPTPLYKNVLPSDMAPYKYFVSDSTSITTNPSISAIYHPNTNANKIVLKFNTIQSIPTITVSLDGTAIATSITVPANGLLVLYYNGSSWATTPWSNMPKFNNDGSINILKNFGRITVTQISSTPTAQFSGSNYANNVNVSDDLTRMHVVEISPRIEIDLTSYVMELEVAKQLDSKNNYIPISSINPNTATLTLSAIPLTLNNAPVPIFSSQNESSVLYNMMRKNIKFYFNWHLENYFQSGEYQVNDFIPAGVYYANAWDETDIETVRVTCYDIVNYLQMLPVPDYVASNKSIFDILTNIMDMAGFTDYDYDSLYSVTNDAYTPLDMYYYFCNSQSSTLYDALSELFLAHQIGAYIDEFGIMKFLSLTNIMRNQTPTVYFNDASMIQGGYSITNKTKPGAITVSYQEPKVTQSLALQNATDPNAQNSPSFTYTTSNEVVWSQKDADSVGSNYLSRSMAKNDNYFQMNNNSLLDIFHTYLLNNDGYAVIENEIVSFLYKEYKLSQTSNPLVFQYVYPKTDLELSSSINQFIKQNQIGLVLNNGLSITQPLDVTVTPTGKISNIQRGLFGTKPDNHVVISNGILDKGLTAINCSTSVSNVTLSSTDNPTVAKIAVVPSGDAIIYNNSIVNPGFKTYSAKFDLNGTQVTSGGVFFNTSSNQYSVNLIQVQTYTQQYLGSTLSTVYSNPPKYNYFITLVQKNISTNTSSIIAMVEATGVATQVQQNWERVLTLVPAASGAGQKQNYSYAYGTDQEYHLKVSLSTSDGTDGEVSGQLIDVYLNNILVTGWQIPEANDNNAFIVDDGVTSKRDWKSPGLNTNTGLVQKVNISSSPLTFNGNFGFITSSQPLIPTGLYTYPGYVPTGQISANLREIYACEKPLLERSVNYYYQDPEFLNGLIQNRNLFSQYKSYMMQTNPEVTGLNYYDIQYQTPAATSVDVLPIEYLWFYFPGTQPTDQQYYQQQMVDEYSLSYSTPINTGFRARLAIVNNVGHMVYLTHSSDSINQFNVSLNLWTHEVVAPSDAQVIQRTLDASNKSEVIQVDSPWIQSKSSANRLIDLIAIGNDGFSKDTSIQVWGNPLIQVGDIVNLNYSLSGIVNGKYLVHGVDHVFKNGLKTTLTLNSINKVMNPANT